MATNRKQATGDRISKAPTHPTTPSSGQPCRLGRITGVALIDERSDGLVTIQRDGVFELSVSGVDNAGNAAVAAGDPLYYVDSDIDDGSGFLSKKATAGSFFFGHALEAVASGATANIDVLLDPAGDTRIA